MTVKLNSFCCQRINFYEIPEIASLSGEGKVIMDYCVKRGSERYIGIFSELRGTISFKLKIDDDFCHNFFISNPALIEFCPITHFIWIKNFFTYIDCGISKDVFKTKTDSVTGASSQTLDFTTIYDKNDFIKNIKDALNSQDLRNHPFREKWIKYNLPRLNLLEDQLSEIRGNNRNFDKIIDSINKEENKQKPKKA
jgi:hypothetical protein